MDFKGRNKISLEFSMSSMTDVVFLLLIFFMIASTLAKNLNTIDVELPKSKGKSENRNNVTITINNASQFFIDSKQVPKKFVGNELMDRLKKNNSSSIIIRAEKKVPIDQLVFVMSLANQNGVKVVLAVDSQ